MKKTWVWKHSSDCSATHTRTAKIFPGTVTYNQPNIPNQFQWQILVSLPEVVSFPYNSFAYQTNFPSCLFTPLAPAPPGKYPREPQEYSCLPSELLQQRFLSRTEIVQLWSSSHDLFLALTMTLSKPTILGLDFLKNNKLLSHRIKQHDAYTEINIL